MIGLKTFPASLWRLKLEQLELSYKENIPEEIGRLKTLKSLTLSMFILSKLLPKSLWQLDKLEYLRLSFLEIKKIPQEIGQLQALQRLELISLHSLQTLPASLAYLNNLQEISIINIPNILISPALKKCKEIIKYDSFDIG